MGSEQLPTHSEMGEMSAGFPICWLYPANAVHLFSSEHSSLSSRLGPGQKPACLSQQQGPAEQMQVYSFPPLNLVHPLVPTPFWSLMQQKDTTKNYLYWILNPKFNLQQLSTFSVINKVVVNVINKVHVGCVKWQRPQETPGLLSVLHISRRADTELDLHTVFSVHLLDFIFLYYGEKFLLQVTKGRRVRRVGWGVIKALFFFCIRFPSRLKKN